MLVSVLPSKYALFVVSFAMDRNIVTSLVAAVAIGVGVYFYISSAPQAAKPSAAQPLEPRTTQISSLPTEPASSSAKPEAPVVVAKKLANVSYERNCILFADVSCLI